MGDLRAATEPPNEDEKTCVVNGMRTTINSPWTPTPVPTDEGHLPERKGNNRSGNSLNDQRVRPQNLIAPTTDQDNFNLLDSSPNTTSNECATTPNAWFRSLEVRT